MIEPASTDELQPEYAEEPLAALAGPAEACDPEASLLRRQQAMVVLGRRTLAPPEMSVFMQESAAMIAKMLNLEHSATAEVAASASKLVISISLSGADSAKPTDLVEEIDTGVRDSLAGYVLHVGRPVALLDWEQEDRFRDPLLTRHGIQCAVAVPLIVQNGSFGALIAASSRVRSFSTDDLLFAENIAHLVTATVARRKSKQALDEERSFSTGLLRTVGAVVLVLDAEGRILRSNPTCQRVIGFSTQDLQDRAIWEVFPVADRLDVFQVIFEKLRSGIWPVEYESAVLAKDSSEHRIAWSYSPIMAADGSIQRIVASGIDITEQRLAEDEIKRLEAANRDRGSAGKTQQNPKDLGEGTQADKTEKSPDGPVVRGVDERRRSPRRAYPYRQLVGYILDGTLPDPDNFHHVDCHDIAANGISFLSPRPTLSDKLVVALGNAPRLTYLTAQVVHATRVNRRGARMFLIGCNYLGRVRY